METETVRQFIERINAHDDSGCFDLMANNFQFVDSVGGVHEGRRPGFWQAYFNFVPDYHIKVDEVYIKKNIIIILGTASGTYLPPGGEIITENYWTTTIALRVVVSNNMIESWQVIADNEPIRKIMRKYGTCPED